MTKRKKTSYIFAWHNYAPDDELTCNPRQPELNVKKAYSTDLKKTFIYLQ